MLGEHPGSVGSALGSWTLYIPGLGIDDRVAMVTMSGSTATDVHFYLPNRLGSVIGMVGGLWGSAAHGTLTDQYLYSPYGVEEPLAGSGNMYRYTGRYYDGETGLYYYRSRYYSAGGIAGGGRFLQPDSILYDGGFNLYSYVGGNPINNVDPLGTNSEAGFERQAQAMIELNSTHPVLARRMAIGAGVVAGVLAVAPLIAASPTAMASLVFALEIDNLTSDTPSFGGSGKIIKISASKSPQAAAHLTEAGATGRKLTVDRAGAAGRRAEALKGTKTKSGLDRDEVPPAILEEGGKGASVKLIDSSDNRSAGAQLSNQLRV